MELTLKKILGHTCCQLASLSALVLATACSGNDVALPSPNGFTDDELGLPGPEGLSERRPIEASLDVEGEALVVSLRNSTSEAAWIALNASIDAPDGSYINDNAAEVRVPAGEELRVVLAGLDGFDVSGHDWSRAVLRYEFTLDKGRHGIQSTELAILDGQVVPREQAIASGRQRPDLVLDSDDGLELKQANTFTACFSNIIDLLPRLASIGGPPEACPRGTPDPTGGGCVNGLDHLIQNHQVLPMPGQMFTSVAPNGASASGFLDVNGCTRALTRQTGNWRFQIWLYTSRAQQGVFYMASDGLLQSKEEVVAVPSAGNPARRDVQVASAFRPWQAAVFLANNTFVRASLIGALPPGNNSLRISARTEEGAGYCHTGTERGCTTRNTLVASVGVANERGTMSHETGHFLHKVGSAANLLANYDYSNTDAGNPSDGCLGLRTAGHNIDTVEWQSAAHIEGLADFFKAVTYNDFTPGSNCRSPLFFGTAQVAVFDCEAAGKTLEAKGCVEWTNSNFGRVGNEIDWTKMYWDYLADQGGNMTTYMNAERAVASWPSAAGGDHLFAILEQLNDTEEVKLVEAIIGNLWEGTPDQ